MSGLSQSRRENAPNYKRPVFWVIIVAMVAVVAVVVGLIDKPAGSITYENDKYGFSMILPKDFADKVDISEEGNFVFFTYKEIQDMYPDGIIGVVGRIEIYDKKETTKNQLQELADMYNLKYLGENENYYFGWAHATDVQIPPNASDQIKENYRALEDEFDQVIKTFKVNSELTMGKYEDSAYSSKDDYSLVVSKQAISLGSQDIQAIYKILGKPISENDEVLDSRADTFTGSHIKTLKYEGIEIKLFAPKDNPSAYWIMLIDVTGSDIQTPRGIAIGSTLEQLKEAYSNLEMVPENRTDKSTYTYRVGNYEEFKHMEYTVKDGIVTQIRLYAEMP